MQIRKQRRKSRKAALQILYCCEIGNINPSKIIDGKINIPEVDEIDDYAKDLVLGTSAKIKLIDKKLDEVSENWAIERMPVVDKCLLRQSYYEMAYMDEVPVSVSINEAVELAKQFCAEDDSHKYVNGVLGKLAKEVENV